MKPSEIKVGRVYEDARGYGRLVCAIDGQYVVYMCEGCLERDAWARKFGAHEWTLSGFASEAVRHAR